MIARLALVALLALAAACGDSGQREAPAADAASRATGETAPEQAVPGRLPMRPGSIRFAVVGDTGRGDPRQYMTASKMIEWRQWFDYSFVLMLGDNIYAAGTPEDFAQRFERPYQPLLDAGVTFHAAIGNHDPPAVVNYPLFHMNGRHYYTFEKSEGRQLPLLSNDVLFMAIDTVDLTHDQLRWIERELTESDAEWKIAFYHHPLYTSGRYQFWASRLRSVLEPIFVQHGLDVGLSGHEHFYERIRPQRGVHYFTSGAGGALRTGDLRRSEWTAAGFDSDTHFMLMEIAGDTLSFLTISREGEIIDWGTVRRRDS